MGIKFYRIAALLFGGIIAATGFAGNDNDGRYLPGDRETIAATGPSAHQRVGNLFAYPYQNEEPPVQTPAPEGYVPFHIEHYGRHGSRWLIGENDYLTPVARLEAAERNGKLTPLGEKTLKALREIYMQSEGRLGELSDNGALQHQAIGRRMASNYPEIFNKNADIDAKSTVVIRCILSMANALKGIEEVAPGINAKIDASYADMWFMNYDDKPAWEAKSEGEKRALHPYQQTLAINDSYLDRLVTDHQFAVDSVQPGLLPYLYWVLGNTQSHIGQPWLFEEVFTPEEQLAQWKSGNSFWFVHGGNTDITNGRMPFAQRKLLGRIIEQADSAIFSDKPSARLRYGHDGILVSIITLMELGGYGDKINDLSSLYEAGWRDYAIIPMGGNLQLIFYRKPGSTNPDDVLVKAMINEREVRMPGEPVSGPYYRWTDVRKYYLDKLSSFREKERL